jgi:hypothetical protein
MITHSDSGPIVTATIDGKEITLTPAEQWAVARLLVEMSGMLGIVALERPVADGGHLELGLELTYTPAEDAAFYGALREGAPIGAALLTALRASITSADWSGVT